MDTNGEKSQHKNPKLQKDRRGLCDLPDEILIHILSLLPTKSAVATSILSRRWRFLWTSITNIEIRDDWFRERSQFMNFLDRAMVLRNGSSLVSYHLSCKVLSDAARVNTWISSTVQCNVEELSLDLQDTEPSYLLPSCIFGSQSPVKLNLVVENHILRVPSSSTYLSNLKCLRLDSVEFADVESNEKLLSHPLLEELVICWCNWRNTKPISISSPKLQLLEIHDYCYSRQDDFSVESKVWIFGDNLKSFLFEGVPVNEYRICGSTLQLLKAQILVHWECILDRSYRDVAANHCYKLVNGLSRVHDLTLTEDLLMLLDHIPELIDTIPVFECLTRLNLDDINEVCIDGAMLMKIYERCPLLEHLNVMKELTHRLIGPLLTPMPACFRTHLKKITVLSYAHIEEDAIDILLNSASVLEEMIVLFSDYAGSDEDGTTVIKELEDALNRRARVSKDCRISVVLDLPKDV